VPISLPTVDIDPILALIRLGLPVAKTLATFSKATMDDQAIALMEQAAVEGSPLLVLLRTLLNDPLVQMTTGEARNFAVQKLVEGNAAAAGFDVNTIVQVVTWIMTLLGWRR
jgi:hypothetical protein